MPQQNINEDFLLLLIKNSGIIDTTIITVDNHFETETTTLKQLCEGGRNNIYEIIKFINNSLIPKLPNKTFNYCIELDRAYRSVYVNIEVEIQDIIKRKELIFKNQNIASKDKKEFNLEENFRALKNQIKEKIELWFKVFNIEFAYERAKKVTNMLVYSHRKSGWLNPEFRITENLKQEVKTNFGYGSVSYFYSLLTYKNIQITPLSEWIDYRYSNFSEVIRYTKSFGNKIPLINENGRSRYFKIKIDNSHWHDAIEFTKNAANLSLTNEKEFIEKYITGECEIMVNGLETFYQKSYFEFIDEEVVNVENKTITRHRVNINGYELIDFRTEKIIGALDFLTKLTEYSSIISTNEYTNRIIAVNKKFIPNVFIALENQNLELKKAEEDYNTSTTKNNQLLEKNKFYQNERFRLLNEFNLKYKEEYKEFQELLNKSNEEIKHYNHTITLHTENINKLSHYISKYKEIVKE